MSAGALTGAPSVAELEGVQEFERAIRELGEYDARLAHIALVFLGALACAACAPPMDPPTFSLTCDYAEHSVLVVPEDSAPRTRAGEIDERACYEVSADPDWRVTLIAADACPEPEDTCVAGPPGAEFVVYRTQKTWPQQGGLTARWVACADACRQPPAADN